jgi:UPF0271 protein
MRSSPDRAIDLNADVGEGPDEEPLYALISSANIACGGHAGDEATMREAVQRALRHGVAVGAHPSYPDRAGFGRVTMTIAPSDLAHAVAVQVEALVRVAGALGARAAHVKPHGALYNDAARRREVAIAVADGVEAVSRDLLLVGLAGSGALALWRERGFRVASEAFADRAYGADGLLVPRARAGALISDPIAAAAQAVRLAEETGCDTICVHSDTPGAASILAAVRRALLGAGFSLRAASRG